MTALPTMLIMMEANRKPTKKPNLQRIDGRIRGGIHVEFVAKKTSIEALTRTQLYQGRHIRFQKIDPGQVFLR